MSDPFKRLINLSPDSAEANVASLLRELLQSFDGEIVWELETSVESGRADLACIQLNTVIECKKTDSINAKILNDAKSQLLRYIQDSHSLKDDLKWRGFITDGKVWWGFDYNTRNQNLKRISGLDNLKTIDNVIFTDICSTYIFNRFDSTRLKIPKIHEINLLEKMFLPRYRELLDVQRQVESTHSYKTKIKLWEMQLAGSGIIPTSDEPMSFGDHFCRHSFIVSVARMLCAYLEGNKANNDEIINAANDGFQAWILESDVGYNVMVRLVEDLRQYSWRTTTYDVLKSLYHGLIPQEKRKEFGEFYTPDNLAIALVAELLDDKWCDKQILRAWDIISGRLDDRKGFGVLDPSCGSGTFLFHAAKRLSNRIASNHRVLKQHTTEIVSQLVFGIDVHPVAVEMSKATLLMALPPSTKSIHLQVALGDSMQTEGVREDLFVKDGLRVETPQGNEILISSSILSNPDGLNVIKWAIDSSVNPNDAFDENSEYCESADCLRLANSIKEVIAQEENHVWNWHLANRYTMHRFMSGSVGRLIGNPPWLVQNETPDGTRKEKISQLKKSEGTYVNVPGYLAKGDLASVFTARVTRLFLDSSRGNNRYGWVLPGSALINQVWKNWRDSELAYGLNLKHEVAWSLDDLIPPIFSHAPNGTCVVLGKRTKTRKNPNLKIERWSGALETAKIEVQQAKPKYKQSVYFEKVQRGCFFGPFLYFIVEKVSLKQDDLWSITTQIGAKGQWKGKYHEGKVEKAALLPLVVSKDLDSPFAESKRFLIAPIKEGELMLPSKARADLYPYTDKFWKKCNTEYKRLSGEAATDLLEENYGFPKSLDLQLAYKHKNGKVKVA